MAAEETISLTQLFGTIHDGHGIIKTLHTLEGFSNHNISTARAACQLQAMLRHPSNADFINMVCLNFIKKCLITVSDACNTSHIFGCDITSTRGKTTRHKSEPVIAGSIKISLQLKELNKNVTICVDIMFVLRLGFDVTGSWGIHFLTQQHVPVRMEEILANATINVMNFYDSH